MSTLLGMPEVPAAPPADAGPVEFADASHHFRAEAGVDIAALAEAAPVPLSVILQVTKRCNFDCSFCSETLQLPDPSQEDLDEIRAALAGVRRVFLSGGEPLLRRDFVEIVDMYSAFVIGVPTNATRGVQLAPRLVDKVAFVNVGLEGPRSTTNRVRGDYDLVLAGIYAFLECGLHRLPAARRLIADMLPRVRGTAHRPLHELAGRIGLPALRRRHGPLIGPLSRSARDNGGQRRALPPDLRGATRTGVTSFIRQAKNVGWDVCVITTPRAAGWVNLDALAGLTGHPVRTDYKLPDQPDVLPPPDAIAVAPATFNTINKWAAGIADNLVLGLLTEAIGLHLPIAALPYINAAQADHPLSAHPLTGCAPPASPSSSPTHQARTATTHIRLAEATDARCPGNTSWTRSADTVGEADSGSTHPPRSPGVLDERTAGMDVVVYGKIIIDDLRLPDGSTACDLLGGGGPQAAFGALLWTDTVGLLSRAGEDLEDHHRRGLASLAIDLTPFHQSGGRAPL
jgi:Radical SAM superfamily/Flavoprotein